MKLVKLTITSLARMIDHEHIKIVQTHISIIYILFEGDSVYLCNIININHNVLDS